MWIPGIWRLRSCLGHHGEVECTGDIIKYCKVVTAMLDDGKMEVEICPHGYPDIKILFRLEDSEDIGQDNVKVGKATDNGMEIKGPNLVCEFTGEQLTITKEMGVGFPGFTVTKVFDLQN